MNKQWQTVALGEVLKLVSRNEKVNPIETYNLLGIRINGNGVFYAKQKRVLNHPQKNYQKLKQAILFIVAYLHGMGRSTS